MNEVKTHFRSKEELKKHISKILQFYYPDCIDKENGGYINGFLDDGTINDRTTKHLVGTSRFIYIFSVGAILDGPDWCLEAAEHGIRFLRNHHRDPENGGYFFEMNNLEVADERKMAYGHAFAFLAAAIAHQAGVEGAKELIDNTYDVLEEHFWDEEHGFYMDEWNVSWSEASSYRGQNANMHLCEAMLTAYEATNQEKYLEKAYRLAQGVTRELAGRAGGMVWEHYTTDWQPDWEFNKGNTKAEFRPYGFLPGHQLEWSKLLMWLDRHRSEPWMLETAEKLFHKGWKKGWDEEHGGIFFALAPDEKVIDADKNYWVMAEAISAASLLGAKTGNEQYWTYYDKLFAYSSKHLIDHQYGGWFKLLNKENEVYSNEKSSPPKTDYHPVAACYQTILALG